ncbi:MAG: hypothetical protein QM775_13150 [Pirellulales bacterium]
MLLIVGLGLWLVAVVHQIQSHGSSRFGWDAAWYSGSTAGPAAAYLWLVVFVLIEALSAALLVVLSLASADGWRRVKAGVERLRAAVAAANWKLRGTSWRRFAHGSAVVCTIAATVVASVPVQAADYTWVGGGAGNLWSDTANWNPNTGTPSATGDTATFNIGSNLNIDATGSFLLRSLNFQTGAGAFVIDSGTTGTFTLDGGAGSGIFVNAGVTAAQTFGSSVAFQLGGNVDFTNNGSGTLFVNGGITAATTGTKVLTLGGTGAGRLGGTVGNGAGTVALTMAGSGTWTLAGSNGYTGTTTLTSGTLVAANVSARRCYCGPVAT